MKKRTRIELHCHTKMSAGKGLIEPGELVRYACDNGYKAMAVTDCGTVQAFPEAYRTWKELWEKYRLACRQKGEEVRQEDFLKVIYGLEGYLTDEFSCSNEKGHSLWGECTVVAIETTGISASKDRILRMDAVKMKDGELKERFSSTIIQEQEISEDVLRITGITEEDFKNAKEESQVLSDLIGFIGDSFLVMYGAAFDMRFLKKACKRHDLCMERDYIDLYQICKYLNPSKRIKLPLIMEKYRIGNDCADNDCMRYARIFSKVCSRLKDRNINTIEELKLVIDKKRVRGTRKWYPILLYAKNETGIRNLYRIVTESNLKAYDAHPTITKETLDKYRDGILVGSVCDGGEVMAAVHTALGARSDEEYRRDIRNVLSYYDFVEVSPFGKDKGADARYLYQVLKNGGMLVAASDAYYLNEEDQTYWDILTSGRGEAYTDRPRYPVKWDEVKNPFGCRTSGAPEILKDIPETVVSNQSVIADQIEYITPLREGVFMPAYPDAEQKLRHICEERLQELFGEKPTGEARDRLYRELDGICHHGYAGIFMLWRDLVQKSKEKGYPFSSRGSVASSLVAFLCGITEINPLSAACGGYDIPVETFLGIHLDRKPDIDLNFAPDIQAFLQNYVKELPGVADACCGGTIAVSAEKTARMHVEEYYDHNGLPLPGESILKEQTNRLCGIKRSDGFHPAGIIVTPVGEELVSFTPLQHPWNSSCLTTHFDYHVLADNLLKMDILGYEPMNLMHELKELTGVAADAIPREDAKTLEMLCDPAIEEIKHLPEFGSAVARRLIKESRPKTYDDLIKVCALMHGTNVWPENQDELIITGKLSLKECMASRDDIFMALVNQGMQREKAYTIMDSVRRGKGLTEDMRQEVRQIGMPEWFMGVCERVRYMFPKAHAVSYTLVAWRAAYYMTYFPAEYREALAAAG